jgi:type II secretory pathway pseudopilin PulG
MWELLVLSVIVLITAVVVLPLLLGSSRGQLWKRHCAAYGRIRTYLRGSYRPYE